MSAAEGERECAFVARTAFVTRGASLEAVTGIAFGSVAEGRGETDVRLRTRSLRKCVASEDGVRIVAVRQNAVAVAVAVNPAGRVCAVHLGDAATRSAACSRSARVARDAASCWSGRCALARPNVADRAFATLFIRAADADADAAGLIKRADAHASVAAALTVEAVLATPLAERTASIGLREAVIVEVAVEAGRAIGRRARHSAEAAGPTVGVGTTHGVVAGAIVCRVAWAEEGGLARGAAVLTGVAARTHIVAKVDSDAGIRCRVVAVAARGEKD